MLFGDQAATYSVMNMMMIQIMLNMSKNTLELSKSSKISRTLSFDKIFIKAAKVANRQLGINRLSNISLTI